MLVADNIKSLMEARGLDAAKLGRLAGINATGVYDIISGKSQSPKIGTIAKIAGGLNVPIASIFEESSDLELRSDLLHVIDQLDSDQRDLLLKTARAWTGQAS